MEEKMGKIREVGGGETDENILYEQYLFSIK